MEQQSMLPMMRRWLIASLWLGMTSMFIGLGFQTSSLLLMMIYFAVALVAMTYGLRDVLIARMMLGRLRQKEYDDFGRRL